MIAVQPNPLQGSESDHLVAFGHQFGEAGMPLELTHEFDAALLHLFLDTEGPRAVGTGALNLILHRLEMLVVRVLRIGEFANPPGPRPVEDDAHLVALFLELFGDAQDVDYSAQTFVGLRVRQDQDRYFSHAASSFYYLDVLLISWSYERLVSITYSDVMARRREGSCEDPS